ncbi:urotensin-related peptide 1 [Megalobrama amblycephala]|uniref:urotensin-related peptide 1 n=1 Tax=Megalobrama amblycephala TaxID=75352 RepID=UPI0020145EC8|nr:urotensin-related peptide 1 [Megalobrama amblycephala]
MASEDIKLKMPAGARALKTEVTRDPLNMLSLALLYILAVVCSVRRTHALPLYSDTALPQQEELIQKLVAEVEEGQSNDLTEQRDIKTVLPVLLQRGTKETLQQEKMNNMVDDLKAVVLKLAAADNLRSQGYVRSEQNLPKNNKRACFWKYCVTN